MKCFILIFTLLVSSLAYAQPNREELALVDETAFDLSFTFRYEGETAFTITLKRKDKADYISISGENSCRRNNAIYETPIADRYVYEQFLDYLENINITNYQPLKSSLDDSAKLSVQVFISIARTWTMNAFVFQYHPNKMGDEKQILEFVVDILKDNASDDCSRDLAETLSVYVNGT
jgi:hypothetical protein